MRRAIAAIVAASFVMFAGMSSATGEPGEGTPTIPPPTIIVYPPTTDVTTTTIPEETTTTTVLSDPPESHDPEHGCTLSEDGRYRLPNGRFCRISPSTAQPVGSGATSAAVPVRATPAYTG